MSYLMGPSRFISKQAVVIPEFAKRAEYLPDIGHFIKCISGGLHKIAGDNSHLRGVHLLEAARIKTMCDDISRILRQYQYGVEFRQMSRSNDLDMKEKLDQGRNVALKRISCVIPHHCGYHENCTYGDCRMVQIQRQAVAKHRVESPESNSTVPEILQENRKEILEKYVKVSRFNKKVVSMGKRGQATCYNL
ncbi:hypothetical protein ACHAXR_006341 [Thalassiosira sp. AJA248-18]